MKKTIIRLTLVLLLAVSSFGIVGTRNASATCYCSCSPYGQGQCAFACEGDCSVRQVIDLVAQCCNSQ